MVDVYSQRVENVESEVVKVLDGRDKKPDANRKRGRPVEREMPDPIPATPEEVMRALVETPPKADGEWKYIEEHKRRKNR